MDDIHHPRFPDTRRKQLGKILDELPRLAKLGVSRIEHPFVLIDEIVHGLTLGTNHQRVPVEVP
jgi:hypothetical protein